ncbi:hypothetical protein HD806DRAFT_462362 [Xylariaceae sp. AK1471]|nr:hypothetical protein HD806DRAFT_462362 [Xylariaceae sp. AK1471]
MVRTFAQSLQMISLNGMKILPIRHLDYYGVTFDCMIPPDDPDPDVLQINIIELEIDEGPFASGVGYANKYLLFTIDPAKYVGEMVLAVPRCCQKRKGTQARGRVNGCVAMRDGQVAEMRGLK